MCFDPEPSLRWLFCPTHPDDELAICCWIRELARSGNSVHICWAHSDRIRRDEAMHAAESLGVPPESLHFLPGTDGAICDQLVDLFPQLAEVMEQVRPDRVAVGAFEQGHLDHDATNWLVKRVAPCPVLEFPLYHTYLTSVQVLNRFADATREEVRNCSDEQRAFKIHLAKQYPSQNIWNVLLAYEAWQGLQLKRPSLARSERMRVHEWEDFRIPQLPQPLQSRVEASATWRRWRDALENAELFLRRGAFGRVSG